MLYGKFLAALAAVAMAGCMTVGTRFDPELVDTLRPGQSTMDEAIALLGTPTSTTALGSGRTLLQWQYSQGRFVRASGAYVSVLFDAGGTMVRGAHRNVMAIWARRATPVRPPTPPPPPPAPAPPARPERCPRPPPCATGVRTPPRASANTGASARPPPSP